MFRIIPAIDIRSGRCVRLQQGDYQRQTTYEPRPVDMAMKWQDAGAPLIHVVDLDGAKEGHPCNLGTVAAVCAAVRTPCELGGGIRTLADVRAALAAGVSRVILGTSVAGDPSLAGQLLAALPAPQLVAGIDARDGRVAVRGWLEDSGREAVDLAGQLYAQGLRHFIYTDIRTDGMFTGPNVKGVAELCQALPAAGIIAAGGVGGAEHVRALTGLGCGNLEGVIVGKALYDGRVSYAELVAAAGSQP